jgi:uncharacterized LabA/DUF88 family protein
LSEVALFIDLENISTSLWKNFDQNPDPFDFMEKARKYGAVSFARAYGDFSQPPLQRMQSDLRSAGIDQFDCDVKVRGTETQSTVDTNIVIDLFEVALDRPNIKTFVLMAGDSDYIRVVTRLRNRLGKDVVIAAVPGSVSRDLVRAAGKEDPIEPAATDGVEDSDVIRLIDRYESSRREGVYPTFGKLLEYVTHPSNASIVDARIAQGLLTEFVEDGLLVQEQIVLPDGRELRTTRLDRSHPDVAEALGLAPA